MTEGDVNAICVSALREVVWAHSLISRYDKSIANGSETDLRTICFEIRYAFMLHSAGIKPNNEAPGEGDSTIDFSFPDWNVELLSLDETNAAKAATKSQGAVTSFLLSSPTGHPPLEAEEYKSWLSRSVQSEEGEAYKLLERITSKVF